MALVEARMPAVPSLPLGPVQYDRQYVDQLNNVLRLYFNQLNNVVGKLVANQFPYQSTVAPQIARRTAILTAIGTTFLPLISIRLKSSASGAVVLPQQVSVCPTINQNYEVVLVKNSTLTGASWVTGTFQNVDYDVTATAMTTTATTIVQSFYLTVPSQAVTPSTQPNAYSFYLQLAEVSDIYTVAIRTVSGATTGDAVGSLSFYDLTQ